MYRLIDEVYEVQEYLNGKKVSERGRYRAAYYIARWYTQEGLDFRETRNKVYDWAKSTNNFIKYNVNDIVTGARQCQERLKDNITLRISEADVNRIVELFDSDKARKLALSLLCYAKVYANRDGEFTISMSALSEWIGISRTSVSSKYLPELEALGYITRLDNTQPSTRWHHRQPVQTNKFKSIRLKINTSLYNAGRFRLIHNDIDKLYDEIFTDTERTVFNLPSISDGSLKS